MLRLSLEIPTVKLAEWSPLVDLDFVLAHKVLQDPIYAEFFRERPLQREAILDNSTHEFGKPMPPRDLAHAADIIRPDFVVAPDIVTEGGDEKQYNQNLEWLREHSATLGRYYPTGAVLCGPGFGYRHNYVARCVGKVKMLCFTFHEPNRLTWWDEFTNNTFRSYFKRIHILGMTSLEELRQWVKISQDHPEYDFSFDTSKPLKWGVQGKYLKDMNEVRGGSIKSKEVLDMTSFTEEQEKCIVENIKFLRAVCRGEV